MTMDADGHDLKPVTPQDLTAIAPAWGPDNALFYPQSIDYAPFTLMRQDGARTKQIRLPFHKSVYSVALNRDYTKMAVAVAEDHGGTSIYVGNLDGSGMTRVSFGTPPILMNSISSWSVLAVMNSLWVISWP